MVRLAAYTVGSVICVPLTTWIKIVDDEDELPGNEMVKVAVN
jgi:hypothetical protein